MPTPTEPTAPTPGEAPAPSPSEPGASASAGEPSHEAVGIGVIGTEED
ncbi:hypothetical protein [Microbacterium paulum]